MNAADRVSEGQQDRHQPRQPVADSAEFGMRPISQVAIDDVWSALRFRVLRTGEAPFTGGR